MPAIGSSTAAPNRTAAPHRGQNRAPYTIPERPLTWQHQGGCLRAVGEPDEAWPALNGPFQELEHCRGISLKLPRVKSFGRGSG